MVKACCRRAGNGGDLAVKGRGATLWNSQVVEETISSIASGHDCYVGFKGCGSSLPSACQERFTDGKMRGALARFAIHGGIIKNAFLNK